MLKNLLYNFERSNPKSKKEKFIIKLKTRLHKVFQGLFQVKQNIQKLMVKIQKKYQSLDTYRQIKGNKLLKNVDLICKCKI